MPIISKIRFDGVKQKYHLSPLRTQIKELYKQGLSSRKVSQKINISHTRVLQLLKKENIICRSITKIIPNKNYKKLTCNRAYLLGVMCGDGCVFLGKAHKQRWDYNLYNVNLSVKDKDFIDKFIQSIKCVYGVTPSLYYRDRNKLNKKWSNIWIAKLTRKEIYEDLSSYEFGTKNWEVPKEILKSNNEKIIGTFLRGFYDSEGSVLTGIRSFTITICSINHQGLSTIKKLLSRIKIKTSIISEDKRYHNSTFYFSITKKENIEIFLNKVGFSIKRKQNKIKQYLYDKK